MSRLQEVLAQQEKGRMQSHQRTEGWWAGLGAAVKDSVTALCRLRDGG